MSLSCHDPELFLLKKMIQSYLGTKGEQARLKQMKVTGKGTRKAINIPIRNKHKQTMHKKPKISTQT